MSRSNVILIIIVLIFCLAFSTAVAEVNWTYCNAGDTLPAGRLCHTSIYDVAHDRMIIYGGYDMFGNPLSDMWALEESSLTWTQLFPTGDGPPAITSHAAIYDPLVPSMIVFGGIIYPPDEIVSDIWILNLNTLSWEHLAPTGEWPSPRRCLYAEYRRGYEQMIIYGGRYYDHFADTWLFDLTNYTWRQIQYEGPYPSAREGVSVCLVRGYTNLLVYGGWAGEYFDQLWTVNLDNGIWTQYDPPLPHPTARNYNSAICDVKGDRVFIFGGFCGYDGSSLNDLWQINLSDMTYTLLDPTGDIPHARGRHTTLRSGFAGHNAAIFGGCDRFELYFNDTYFLDWDQIVAVDEEDEIPSNYHLSENYPNPFNADTRIDFSVPNRCRVKIEIYDILGHPIVTLIDDIFEAGNHAIIWDGRNQLDESISSGLYIYRLKTDNFDQTKKMLMLK